MVRLYMSGCSPWIDEVVQIKFLEPSSKYRIVYQSPPLFISKNSKVRIEVSAVKGYYNCSAFICTLKGNIIIRVSKKTTGEAYQYSLPIIVEDTFGLSKIKGSKTIDFIPIRRGKYHIEIVLPPIKEAFDAGVELSIKAFVCR